MATKALLFACIFGTLFASGDARADCGRFTGSTMQYGGGPIASWRTDYPDVVSDVENPWRGKNFRTDPAGYMLAVLETVRPDFVLKEGTLQKNPGHNEWWISPWMDYTNNGRERRMGLTAERGPDAKDLSPTSSDGYQVWAVGFYNAPGAMVLGSIFEDECDPYFPKVVQFPEDTVSVKFLFTDASPDEVTYLQGGPEFKAYINAGGAPRPEDRELKPVRLLQVDIAIKDRRASETGWVFGTFVWHGPAKGDTLFDNLVPASLQWGNDPGVYDQLLSEGWINQDLKGDLFGWPERPFLGFNGRANGPADNLRSSCLSCHATARTPAGTARLLGRIDMETEYPSFLKVKEHVDTWFQNIPSKGLFLPDQPAVSVLDYSLQLESAVYRICSACLAGDMTGPTPQICRQTGFGLTRNTPYSVAKSMCAGDEPEFQSMSAAKRNSLIESLTAVTPPRQ